MKKYILLFLAEILCLSAFAQNFDVETKVEYKEDGITEIVFDKRYPGDYTVILLLRSLSNCTSSNPSIHKMSGSTLRVRLDPVNKNETVNFASYRYWYQEGDVNSKVNKEFVYRLPYSEGNTPVVRNLYNIYSRHFGEDVEDFVSYQFMMEKGDTVFASRKGLVMKIVDGNLPVTGSQISYSNKSNQVTIQHEDGTMAIYSVLQNGSFMVKEGDTVYPDTPLALAGTYDEEVYQLRLMIYYYTCDGLKGFDENKGVSSVIKTNYLTPIFATTKGNSTIEAMKAYLPRVTEEMVTLEMTKREKREREKGK